MAKGLGAAEGDGRPSAAAQAGLRPPPEHPASFLRLLLLSDDGEAVSAPNEAGFAAAAELASRTHADGLARTAAQPYSGIRGYYSWEELAGGNLRLELPRGSSRPIKLLAQVGSNVHAPISMRDCHGATVLAPLPAPEQMCGLPTDQSHCPRCLAFPRP